MYFLGSLLVPYGVNLKIYYEEAWSEVECLSFGKFLSSFDDFLQIDEEVWQGMFHKCPGFKFRPCSTFDTDWSSSGLNCRMLNVTDIIKVCYSRCLINIEKAN